MPIWTSYSKNMGQRPGVPPQTPPHKMKPLVSPMCIGKVIVNRPIYRVAYNSGSCTQNHIKVRPRVIYSPRYDSKILFHLLSAHLWYTQGLAGQQLRAVTKMNADDTLCRKDARVYTCKRLHDNMSSSFTRIWRVTYENSGGSLKKWKRQLIASF